MKLEINTKNWFKRREKEIPAIIDPKNEEKPDGGINEKLTAEINERIRSSLKSWADAVQEAENPLNEDGVKLKDLLNIYRNVELDPHITALVETIYNGITQTPFEIEGDDNSEIFEKSWFLDFVRYVLKSENWGLGAINFIYNPGEDSLVVEDVDRFYIRPDQKGFSYDLNEEKADEFFDVAPWRNQIVYIDNDGLGKFNHIAKRFIMKREVVQFWAVFNELFTTPYFIVETDINNDKHRKNLIDWLETRKHSGFAIVGHGDKLTPVSGNTRGFDSYEKFEKASNEDMSKAFLGGTMVLDDGSSRSQSEVHERNLNSFVQAKRQYIEFLINEKVIPILAGFGLINSAARFKWNLSHQYGPKEWADILQKIGGLFKFDLEEISEKLGLKVEEKPSIVPPGPNIEQEETEVLDQKSIKNRISEKLKSLYYA
jgi:hypothetical protein